MGARVSEEDFRAARDVFRRTWENHPGNDLEAIESAIRASLEAYEARRAEGASWGLLDELAARGHGPKTPPIGIRRKLEAK